MLVVYHAFVKIIEMLLSTWIISRIYPRRCFHNIYNIIIILAYILWLGLSTWNSWISFLSNLICVANATIMAVLMFAFFKISFFSCFVWHFFYFTFIDLMIMPVFVIKAYLNDLSFLDINMGRRDCFEVIWLFLLEILVFNIIKKRKLFFTRA